MSSADATEEVLVFVIHCIDDISCGIVEPNEGKRFTGGSVKRLHHMAEHQAWQAATRDSQSEHFVKKIAAGPMLSDDGMYMTGSMFILESTRRQADAFINQDPFKINGVWSAVSISRYVSRPNGILGMRFDGENMVSL